MQHLLWLCASILFFVVEAIVPGVVCLWFGIGAVAALAVSAFTESIAIQTAVFLVVSVLLLAFLRRYTKKFSERNKTKTNFDRIIGERAIVTETIDNISARGKISVLGMEWSARSESGERIEKGSVVTVMNVSGVSALVEKNKNAAKKEAAEL